MKNNKNVHHGAISNLQSLLADANPQNVGEKYEKALEIKSEISQEAIRLEAESYIARIRVIAREADIGWQLFCNPPSPKQPLSDNEIIQVIGLISTLHTFCYGAERLDEAATITGPTSPPVSFYINSVYHYIAALFLLDKQKRPMGGMVYKVLAPIGIANLLDPIKEILDIPMNEVITFGETIRQIRNNSLVHGTFSPKDIEKIVKNINLFDYYQKERLTGLIWELFNHSFVLKLKLIALITASPVDPQKLLLTYKKKARAMENQI